MMDGWRSSAWIRLTVVVVPLLALLTARAIWFPAWATWMEGGVAAIAAIVITLIVVRLLDRRSRRPTPDAPHDAP